MQSKETAMRENVNDQKPHIELVEGKTRHPKVKKELGGKVKIIAQDGAFKQKEYRK